MGQNRLEDENRGEIVRPNDNRSANRVISSNFGPMRVNKGEIEAFQQACSKGNLCSEWWRPLSGSKIVMRDCRTDLSMDDDDDGLDSVWWLWRNKDHPNCWGSEWEPDTGIRKVPSWKRVHDVLDR